MKYILTALLAALLTGACTNKKKPADSKDAAEIKKDSTLVTDSSWGLIERSTSFDDLLQLFGAVNIRDERICGPECADSIDITKLYPETKNEAIIHWKDRAYHKAIAMIECFRDSADWHTKEGIRIGSGFTDLLRLNGQRITFSGFGWDYGGYISSYNNGKLKDSRIGYRLNLSEDPGTNDLYGDTEMHSDMPAVQKAIDKIKVYWLILSFDKPA
jgi:hypothetical protein